MDARLAALPVVVARLAAPATVSAQAAPFTCTVTLAATVDDGRFVTDAGEVLRGYIACRGGPRDGSKVAVLADEPALQSISSLSLSVPTAQSCRPHPPTPFAFPS
jgi:hypothetical protein